MNSTYKVLIWDLPLRVFHWSLACCFFAAWITHEMGTGTFWLHKFFGYSALTLVLWRVAWGFLGSRHASFSSFVTSPRAAFYYLRGDTGQTPTARAGHNPAGGWAILAMLVVVAAQALSGLVNGGELLMEGPWYHVAPKWARVFAHEFHQVNFNILLAIVGLHLAAILFYWLRHKRNLVPAMITGYSDAGDGTQSISSHRIGLALVLLALAALAVWVVISLAPPPSSDPMDMF